MRRLKLDSGIWRYRVGYYWSDHEQSDVITLQILTPAGRLVYIPREDVDQMAEVVAGHWAKAIMPGAVRKYIEARIDTL